MIDARSLTKALRGTWHGRYGSARCPAHQDRSPSLSISQGYDLRVLIRCHAGCTQDAVIAALKGSGLWEMGDHEPRPTPAAARTIPRPAPAEPNPEDEDRRQAALAIWRAAAPAADTLVERYLRARDITLPLPPTMRYAAGLKHGPTGLLLPAMVAAIQAPDGRVAAVHRTFLKSDGSGKAGVSAAKMALGPFGAGAVRLAPAGPVMALAEGVETGMSFMQMFSLPTWAACGSRLHSVALPDKVRHVVIAADNGDAGRAAAEKAAERFEAEGRTVSAQFPPPEFGDFNDILTRNKS